VEKKTIGTVIEVKRQWWLKVNQKPVRMHPLDGATFPHVIRVEYTVAGERFVRRKWIGAGRTVPAMGSTVTVLYREEKPSRARIEG